MKFSLVPEMSPIRGWTPFLEDADRQSYSYVLPFDKSSCTPWNSPSQLDEWFQALHPSRYASDASAWTDAQYKGEQLLRKTAWLSLEDKCDCDYGYSDTWQTPATHVDFCRTIHEITQAVIQATGCRALNSCNLNYYPQGGGVGWHADEEFLFDGLRRPTCIVSLSLGSTSTGTGTSNSHGGEGARKFLVKPRDDTTEEDAQGNYDAAGIQERVLRHGDLMTMEGMFQKHYFHSVWPGDSKEHMNGEDPYTQGERINLTWRTIVKHLDGSDECRGRTCPLSSACRTVKSTSK